jgi:hypothetical protein
VVDGGFDIGDVDSSHGAVLKGRGIIALMV